MLGLSSYNDLQEIVLFSEGCHQTYYTFSKKLDLVIEYERDVVYLTNGISDHRFDLE
jgi:hypothetical protein